MARWYDANAKDDPMNFERAVQILLTREAHAICLRRGWRLHAAGNEESHLHLLMSWIGFIESGKVVQQMKGALSHHLGKEIGPAGEKWFSRGSSDRCVRSQAHFDFLVNTYLPKHSGIFWKEGQPLP